MIPKAFIKAKQSAKLLGLILASINCYSLPIIEEVSYLNKDGFLSEIKNPSNHKLCLSFYGF